MNSFKKLVNIAGWVVFGIAFIVYFMSVERTGSLWDCGEFVTGAYKLQVVHPPGAALFLLIGRMFTIVAEVVSDDPATIAFSVNILSGLCGAFTALFICWVTMILGKLSIVGREEQPSDAQNIALAGAGLIAGLATAFCTSIWFSAVEGEVYSMSTFFTALTLWAVIKWYNLPDNPNSDRWIVFAVYSAGLSIGVHLLSLLTFPALALFYYFKKYKEHNLVGMAAAAGVGVALIVGIQLFVIIGIPSLWAFLERTMVNDFGLPFQSGVFPLVIILAGIFLFGLRYAHQHQNALLQKVVTATLLVVVGFSTIGVVVIRANANTPINMNDPSDPLRLLPYLNREQYGERPLLRGPNFDGQRDQNNPTNEEMRYGRVDESGRYEIVDKKISLNYRNRDKVLFPRMSDATQNRDQLYRRWMGYWGSTTNRPSSMDNIRFFFQYQVGWMYWRYFMWNFGGRQNGAQGYFAWDPTDGNWLSGIKPLDSGRLYNQDALPSRIKNNKARNTYFMLPFLFGLLGMFFHFSKNKNDAMGLLALFIITGIGIIIYSNQPPNEPRERDYVLAGSFFTFSIWIGMGALALFEIFRERVSLSGNIAAPVAVGLVLTAPLLMGFQNFDDHSRRHHSGARDYASNFLESCEPNAIIFTYGDNDTYPLWYAQEVENIRTDVRVVNLSLIAVDWYISQLRRKVNNSPAIKMSLPPKQIRGYKRNQLMIKTDPRNPNRVMNLQQALNFVADDNPVFGGQLESYLPANRFSIPVNKAKAREAVAPEDYDKIVDQVVFDIGKKDNSYLLKGDIAVLDIISNNFMDRPIYFAVTCRQESLLGLDDFVQLEGLALKVVPLKNKDKDYDYLGMMGKGKVHTEKSFENIMTKFRWGNFDKEELFVDRSYGPAIQSLKASMLRTAQDLFKEGKTDKAVQLTDKFFEAFPFMNFKYEYQSIAMMRLYINAEENEKAKKHMKLMAGEIGEYLYFFTTIDPNLLKSADGFRREFTLYSQAKDELIRLAERIGDNSFTDELKGLMGLGLD